MNESSKGQAGGVLTPVAWIDAEGNLHKSPRKTLYAIHGDHDGSGAWSWEGFTLDEAIAAWKRLSANRPDEEYALTCVWGTLAYHNQMQWRYGESQAKGTFECPICGQDSPHTHDAAAIQRGRELDEFIQRSHDKEWEGIDSRIAKLEAAYPWRTPLFTRPTPAAAADPDVLFDGYAVLNAMDERAKTRTSAENVSDVLDAVVRLRHLAVNDAEQSSQIADSALSTAAHDVLAERERQKSAEGWTPEHDDEHSSGELALAAGKYASAAAGWTSAGQWPWGLDSWKPGTPRRMLVKAGALILAEIERMDRAALAKEQK